MKKIGVWLDKDKAFVTTIENGNEAFDEIDSNIEHYHPGGGSGTRFKGGPQDVVHDRKYLERENQQLKQYFKEIALKIKDADALVLFGPAETNEKFRKELHANYNSLSVKVKAVKKTDSMTEAQVKAWVRDFFESN